MSQTLLSYHGALDAAGIPNAPTFGDRLTWLLAAYAEQRRILSALDMPDMAMRNAVMQHIHDAAQLPGTLDDLTAERRRQLAMHAMAIIFTVRDGAKAQVQAQKEAA